MFAYSYHPQTREYLGIENAQKDPKQPGEYLLPAHATFTAPLDALEGYARIWNGTWEYAEDHRGNTIWKDYNTSAVVDQIGPVPEGWSLERPARKLTRQELTEMIYQEKARVAYGGITIRKEARNYRFETDPRSISMSNATLIALQSAAAPEAEKTVDWKVWEDNNPVLLRLTETQFRSIFAAGMTMINAAFALEGAINAEYGIMTDSEIAALDADAAQGSIRARFDAVNPIIEIDEV